MTNGNSHGTLSGYTGGCRCNACRTAMRDWKRGRRAAVAAGGLAADDPRHGTRNGYGNIGCRCRACTTAAVAGPRYTPISEDDARHGTITGYGAGCRCDSCRAAKRDYTRAWRASRS